MSGFSLKTAESTKKVASIKDRASSSRKQETELSQKLPRSLLVLQSGQRPSMLDAQCSLLDARMPSGKPKGNPYPPLHRLLSCVLISGDRNEPVPEQLFRFSCSAAATVTDSRANAGNCFEAVGGRRLGNDPVDPGVGVGALSHNRVLV